MTATVFGICCGERDTAAYRDQYGRMTGAHSVNTINLELPRDGVPINLRHGKTKIGELIYGEVSDTGRVGVVTVVDDGEWLLPFADLDAIYWSPELMCHGPGIRTRSYFTADSAELVGLALTPSPATIAARPVKILPGDIRSSVDRSRWPGSWDYTHPLLKRAVEDIGTSRTRTASRLTDSYDRAATGGGYGPIHYGPPSPILGVS